MNKSNFLKLDPKAKEFSCANLIDITKKVCDNKINLNPCAKAFVPKNSKDNKMNSKKYNLWHLPFDHNSVSERHCENYDIHYKSKYYKYKAFNKENKNIAKKTIITVSQGNATLSKMKTNNLTDVIPYSSLLFFIILSAVILAYLVRLDYIQIGNQRYEMHSISKLHIYNNT